jgi:RNA polymerase sigma-70 factor (ECF subfamily)
MAWRRAVTTASVGEPANTAGAEAAVGRFEDFYLREFSAVVGLAYALSGSSLVAEDIAQEAFMAASKSWERIGNYENPGAWVRRVVANKAKNTIRNCMREAQALARAALKRSPLSGIYELPEEHAEVCSAVRSLPKRQREVVALHYFADFSIHEIADALRIAEGTVKAHLHQGRTTLERQLGGTEPAS